MKYEIPLIPPSINQFIGRTNIWEYQAKKREWKDICNLLKKPPKAIEKAKVTITFYFKDKRRHDADNYLKFLLDGLVTARIIQDDDFDHIELIIKGGYDKENPRTEIIIEEI